MRAIRDGISQGHPVPDRKADDGRDQGGKRGQNADHEIVQLLKAGIDLIEAFVNGLEAVVNGLEAFVHFPDDCLLAFFQPGQALHNLPVGDGRGCFIGLAGRSAEQQPDQGGGAKEYL